MVAFIATLLGECSTPNAGEQITHSPKSLRRESLRMDWLRSEDLKEEKDVTTPRVIIAVHPLCRDHRSCEANRTAPATNVLIWFLSALIPLSMCASKHVLSAL
jgi:hypothetical protein